MTHNLIKQLEETLGDLEHFSPEKLQDLIQETLKTFQELQTQIQSTDPREREKAVDLAMSLKASLEEQTLSLCQSIGMNPQELAKFVENPSNFSKEEWEALGAAKADLDAFKQQLSSSEEPRTAPLKKKKASEKSWIAG